MPEITRAQIEAYRDSQSLLVTDFDRDMARACLAALDRAEAADCEADQLAELVHSLEEQRASVIEQRDEARAEVARLRVELECNVHNLTGERDQIDRWLGEARAEVVDLRSQIAACAAWREQDKAEVGRARAAERDTSAELEQCMADGRRCSDSLRTALAEVAQLKDQIAAIIDRDTSAGECIECGGLQEEGWINHIVGCRRGNLATAATAWREQVANEEGGRIAQEILRVAGVDLPQNPSDVPLYVEAWREQVRREAFEEAEDFVHELSTDAQGDVVHLDTLTQEIGALAVAGEEKPA